MHIETESFAGTSQEEPETYRIPEEVKGPLLRHGRDMRGGMDLANIIREGNCYYLNVLGTAMTGKRHDPVAIACRILSQHIAAAIAAEKGDELSDALVSRHFEQQQKICDCGKKGYRDLACGAVSKQGIATIEYKCVHCGNTDSFNTDHSR